MNIQIYDPIDLKALGVALTRSDERILQAQKSKRIDQFEPKEIASLCEELYRRLRADLGVQRNESPEEYSYLQSRFTQLLLGYFHDLTLGEVKTAFEMLVFGELDTYLPTDNHGRPQREHYQSLSFEYCTRILKAYRLRKNETGKKVVQQLEASREDEWTTERIQLTMDAWMEYFEALILRICTGDIPRNLIVSAWLIRQFQAAGMIDSTVESSETARRELAELHTAGEAEAAKYFQNYLANKLNQTDNA